MFRFSVETLSETFHSKKGSAIYHKRAYVYLQITRYSCQILIKVEISRQVFEKCSNIEFHENRSSGSRVCPTQRDGQAVRHGEDSSRFSQFCEHLSKATTSTGGCEDKC
jgi:hypothetical protein